MAYEGFNYQHQILHPYYLGAVAELREWKCKPTSMDSSLYECSKISTTSHMLTPAAQKHTAYIALGSNLGDRIGWIEKACNLMSERGITVKRTSCLWETAPMYVEDQNNFVNGACEVCHLILTHVT
jgi:hypothetical protein